MAKKSEKIILEPIIIRSLELSDIDAIMQIEPAAYGSHHWSRQSFVSELTNPGGCYFGAFSNQTGNLLGYTGYWLIGEEAHITTLAVHPLFRRRGIAERLLINSVLEALEAGVSWMTLEVRQSNESAQQLYSKYGFRRLGIRKRYYQDNKEDALVLWTERLTTDDYSTLLAERVKAMEMETIRSAYQVTTSRLPLAQEMVDLATA